LPTLVADREDRRNASCFDSRVVLEAGEIPGLYVDDLRLGDDEIPDINSDFGRQRQRSQSKSSTGWRAAAILPDHSVSYFLEPNN
jgi:hypothetical protein